MVISRGIFLEQRCLDFMWCKNVNCNSEMSLELVQDFFDIGSF